MFSIISTRTDKFQHNKISQSTQPHESEIDVHKTGSSWWDGEDLGFPFFENCEPKMQSKAFLK